MQTNDDNKESDTTNQRISGFGTAGSAAAQEDSDETESSSGRERVEGAGRGAGNSGSIWRDGPMRSAEPEFAIVGSTHDNGDADSSAYETNYGDEAQDSSSGAPEGSWSIPVQAGPTNLRLPTNE